LGGGGGGGGFFVHWVITNTGTYMKEKESLQGSFLNGRRGRREMEERAFHRGALEGKGTVLTVVFWKVGGFEKGGLALLKPRRKKKGGGRERRTDVFARRGSICVSTAKKLMGEKKFSFPLAARVGGGGREQ